MMDQGHEPQRRTELLPLAVLGLVGVGLAVWWLLSPDRLAGMLGLGTQRYHRVLGYAPGVLIAGLVLLVYRVWLGPWLGAGRPDSRWPDPRRWWAHAWFWWTVVVLVGLWPPLVTGTRMWLHLTTTVARILTFLVLVTYLYARFARGVGPGASRARQMAVNFGLSALVLLWAAGLIESGFRLWPQTDGMGADKLGTYAWLRLYCRHVTYELPPGVSPHKTVKLRDRARSRAKPEGVFRIAVIGDSVTYGSGVADPADRFTDRLERWYNHPAEAPGPAALAAAGKQPIEVMNLGISGNDIRGYLEMLDGIALPFDADRVVLVHVLNDLRHSTGLPPHTTVEPGRLLGLVLDYSYAANYFVRFNEVQWQFQTSYVDWLVETFTTPKHWDRHVALLTRFGDKCRAARVPVTFAQHPFLAHVDAYPEGLLRVHARLDRAARELGFVSVDFLDVFRGKDPQSLMVNRRDRHPNERAHRLMAELLLRTIR